MFDDLSFFFFFKQKTAYEMRISDWSSDVCSSDLPAKVVSDENESSFFTPREIVSELDRFIIGQNDAKRAVAIALRNRWRRQQLPEDLREEVLDRKSTRLNSSH